MTRDQRIQDAIHGIIDFHPEIPAEKTAWKLLQSPDFQRLRRITQLGEVEFVFPSATHSRFAHSIGVFHCARKLVERIRREITIRNVGGDFDQHRADTAILAALLHDIGHGPFSHTFEHAREDIAEKRNKPFRSHEDFSAQMITSGNISDILKEDGFDPDEIAKIIRAKPPNDMYHAIVSGTFDADRLDYMMRDRYMTGVGEARFDTDWIMDNIRVAHTPTGHILCLAHKALTAAEEFLLARYYLRKDIYFHKTARAMQSLLRAFFYQFALELENDGTVDGLDSHHPLVRFLSEGTLDSYRRLDDAMVWGALHALSSRNDSGTSTSLSRLSRDILERKVPACLDITRRITSANEQINFKSRMDEHFGKRIGETIFFDVSPISLYDEVGSDAKAQHESLMFQLPTPNRDLREITELHDSIIKNLNPITRLERYYFLEKGEYETAKAMMP